MRDQRDYPFLGLRPWKISAVLLSGLAVLMSSSAASAQTLIRQPGEHVDYAIELEPHLLFGLFDPPGLPDGTGVGAGVRLTIPVVKNGFVPTINNSVGISFGVDWVHYEGNEFVMGRCARREPGPGGTSICTEILAPAGGSSNYLYFPVAMQWNFWLAEKFSVFGEPGLALYYEKSRIEPESHVGIAPVFLVGGRWHFLRRAMLTARIGYPAMSLGVSVLF